MPPVLMDLSDDPDGPALVEPHLTCGCASDEITQPIARWVRRLQHLADVHALCVEQGVRVFNAQADLGHAAWGAVRAWRGRGSDCPSAVKRRCFAGLVGPLLGALGVLSAVL